MGHNGRTFPNTRAVVEALTPSYPVFCFRPHLAADAARRFISLFPGTPLYAVKCNPHPQILDALYEAGIRHFDTASLPEIAQICEHYERASAYFMHPVKTRASIETAFKVYGVRHYVVDHINELKKIRDVLPGNDIVAVVRIRTSEEAGAMLHLAGKFGAEPLEAVELLRVARDYGWGLGLAFHVGSQCLEPVAYKAALKLCGEIMEKAGLELEILDIGGGFPAYYDGLQVPPLEGFVQEIRAGLKELALKPTVEIFAEPGRALVANSCSLLTQVQLRKGNRLYINDGIYGALSEMSSLPIRLPVRLIRLDAGASTMEKEFQLYGPTCDSLDLLPGTFRLPADAEEGDWIEIGQVGAYSNAVATDFNGFRVETFVSVMDRPPPPRAADGSAAF